MGRNSKDRVRNTNKNQDTLSMPYQFDCHGQQTRHYCIRYARNCIFKSLNQKKKIFFRWGGTISAGSASSKSCSQNSAWPKDNRNFLWRFHCCFPCLLNVLDYDKKLFFGNYVLIVIKSNPKS